jgi:hypothetical protein
MQKKMVGEELTGLWIYPACIRSGCSAVCSHAMHRQSRAEHSEARTHGRGGNTGSCPSRAGNHAMRGDHLGRGGGPHVRGWRGLTMCRPRVVVVRVARRSNHSLHLGGWHQAYD